MPAEAAGGIVAGWGAESGAGAARAGRARTALLPRGFFGGGSVKVAPALLGCVIEHETSDGIVAAMITEVEAYTGAADPASHAYRGQTARTAVMFGPPGHAYVYFTYGMHFCVNLVCLPEGTASAVLLRAAAITEGAALARRRRLARRGAALPSRGEDSSVGRDGAGGPDGSVGRGRRAIPDRDLARGPALLCQALGIDRELNGADVCDPRSPLRVRAAAGPPGRIRTGPRVGVSTAAEVPWRFWIDGDPTVSAYRASAPRRAKRSARP
ncbi:MAG TPA: DNA-3-methyladenine glycosylase [Streptosporangiaceae bacterium]